MRLRLLAVGRMKTGPERDLLDRYIGRARALARRAGITAFEVLDVDEGRGRTGRERTNEETPLLRARVPKGALLFALDERGSSFTSPELAAIIRRERDAGRPEIVFVVGGPDGLGDDFRASADRLLAFGSATLPHQVVRILVAEQVYRAVTIMLDHPYHRA